MQQNPLLKIQDFGQSIWLDYISRGMIDSGELDRLIREDGIRGVTSNPSIFDKAIAETHDYDDSIRSLAAAGKTPEEIYELLAVQDIQHAADLFRFVYDESDGKYGFVSLEVNPHLAHETGATIEEAHRLWSALNRPNVFIKVPATLEGLPAIRQLIAEGINVNVTLLFGLPRYRKVAEAYMSGLEECAAKGKPLARVASVASFFLSRIDALIDPKLERLMKEDDAKAGKALRLHGQVAVASARVAYQIYKEIFSSDRFLSVARKGARPQPVLWASTSTKNPDYSDVKYVESLIGPETINTLPGETIVAYRSHGNPASRLEGGLLEARELLDLLSQVNIDLDQATQDLEDEGVEKFINPFDKMMRAIAGKMTETRKAASGSQVGNTVQRP